MKRPSTLGLFCKMVKEAVTPVMPTVPTVRWQAANPYYEKIHWLLDTASSRHLANEPEKRIAILTDVQALVLHLGATAEEEVVSTTQAEETSEALFTQVEIDDAQD